MKRLMIGLALFLSLVCEIVGVNSVYAQSVTSKSKIVEFGTSLSLAGALLPWSSQFSLQGAQAMDRRGERCAYAFAYELNAVIEQPVRVISTSISIDQRPLHQGQPVIVMPGEKKFIRGRIYLCNGNNLLQFRIQTADGVVEKTASAVVSGC